MKRFSLALTCLLALAFAGCDSDDDEPGNVAPTAAISFAPQAPDAGEAVTFTTSARDADGRIVRYSWDFDGDGAEDATGQTPSYTFAQQGSFTVTLTVTDDDGATAQATQSVTVGVGNEAPPAPAFEFLPQEFFVGEPVTFTADASDADGRIVRYSWDFTGDGVEDAAGPTVTYSFRRASNPVTITLTVFDEDGLSNSTSQSVVVTQRFNRATITEIMLVDIPFVKPNGEGWDEVELSEEPGPDVFYVVQRQIENGNFVLVDSSAIAQNVTEANLDSLSAVASDSTFMGGTFVQNDIQLSRVFTITLYDRDTFVEDDSSLTVRNELMGSARFDLRDQVGTYPDTLSVEGTNGIEIELLLDWMFE